jgi:hypothetical protein
MHQKLGALFPLLFKMKNQSTFTDDHGVSCSEMHYLPYSSDGNILVSRKSYEKEMTYRRGEIKQGRAYQLPSWDSLKIYSEN